MATQIKMLRKRGQERNLKQGSHFSFECHGWGEAIRIKWPQGRVVC